MTGNAGQRNQYIRDQFLTAQARFFGAGLAVFLIWCLLVAYVLSECFQWGSAAAGGVVAGRP